MSPLPPAAVTSVSRPTGIHGWRASAREIAPLAWPVLIGQVSVLAFATVDTLLVARYSAVDLAALAVGAAAYITIFIGFMGVVLAVSPIAGQLFGAGQHAQAGHQAHQAVWVALGLSVLGSTLLVFPAPFLALSQASPEVADKVRGYLLALAFSLPASLLFTVFRGFNTAVSRPKAVMLLQVGALAVKVPASAALVWGVPSLGLPALGVVGCGIATGIAMWVQATAAWWVVRRDPFYERFALAAQVLSASDLALGVTVARMKRRQSFGVPLFDHQALRLRVADLQARVDMMRLGLRAMIAEPAGLNVRSTAAAKVCAVRLACEVMSECMHIFGSAGVLEHESPLSRWWRDIKMARVGGGTDEVLWEIVAAALEPDDVNYDRFVREWQPDSDQTY